MTIKLYLRDREIDDIMENLGYQSSTILMLAKEGLKLGKNPCRIPELSYLSSLSGLVRIKLYWKTEEEKMKILSILSGILYHIKTHNIDPSEYRYYWSSYYLKVRPKEDSLEYICSFDDTERKESLGYYTAKSILTDLAKKNIKRC